MLAFSCRNAISGGNSRGVIIPLSQSRIARSRQLRSCRTFPVQSNAKCVDRRRRHFGFVRTCEFMQQMTGERFDILATLTQRRNVDLKTVYTVHQVGTKDAFGNRRVLYHGWLRRQV